MHKYDYYSEIPNLLGDPEVIEVSDYWSHGGFPGGWGDNMGFHIDRYVAFPEYLSMWTSHIHRQTVTLCELLK